MIIQNDIYGISEKNKGMCFPHLHFYVKTIVLDLLYLMIIDFQVNM